MLFYLMRHGETDWNAVHRMQGSADIPLNEAGRQLARQAAAGMGEIPFDLVLTSPLCRARETAELVTAGREIPVQVVDDLREMDFGRCEGKLLAECTQMQRMFTNPDDYVPDEGERFQSVYRRAERVLQQVFLPLEGKADHVLVSSHGVFLKGILQVVQQKPIATFWDGPPMPNCAAHVLELSGGTFTVLEEGKIYITE